MKRMNRREFVKMSALATAGAYMSMAGESALAQRMGGSGSTGPIIPPATKPFYDLPVLPNEADPLMMPNLVQVSLDAKRAPVDVNGAMASLWTYNGYAPAWQIRTPSGMMDMMPRMLRVNFKNSLPVGDYPNMLGHQKYTTNLHTHGLHVSPSGIADNMMRIFYPGATGDQNGHTYYEYDLMHQDPGSMNFYHPHIHGCVADQMWGGMAGPLIVEDPPGCPLTAFTEKVMVLKDVSLTETTDGGEPSPYTMMSEYTHGKEGDILMVNGIVNPILTIKKGQIQRWRIVNASTARFYKLKLDYHTMWLVGTDGGPLDKPYGQSEILLSPGERIDVLVQANQSAKDYILWTMPYSRRGNMTSQQIALLTMRYSGTKSPADTMPASVDSSAKRLSGVSIAKTRRLELSMGQGKGYINGLTFIDHENCFKIEDSMVGTYELWEIVNSSGMDHPFHHHVNWAQVESISGGDTKYAEMCTRTPAKKDVTIVPKWGTVRLLIPVTHYTGMTMFHCHIIEHEDIGMMGIWHIMGEGHTMS